MLLAVMFVCYSVLVWFLIKRGEKRTAIAFVVAPLAPGVIAGAMALNPVPFLLVSFFSYLFSLLAVPFFFLYKKLRWLHLWSIVPTSAILGAVAAVPLNSASLQGGFTILNPRNFFTDVGFAAFVGTVFWLVGLAPFGAREEQQREHS